MGHGLDVVEERGVVVTIKIKMTSEPCWFDTVLIGLYSVHNSQDFEV